MLTSADLDQILADDYPSGRRQDLIHGLIDEYEATLESGAIAIGALALAVVNDDVDRMQADMERLIKTIENNEGAIAKGLEVFKQMVSLRL